MYSLNPSMQDIIQSKIQELIDEGWKITQQTDNKETVSIVLERRKGINKIFYNLISSFMKITPNFSKKPVNFIANHIPKKVKQVDIDKAILLNQINKIELFKEAILFHDKQHQQPLQHESFAPSNIELSSPSLTASQQLLNPAVDHFTQIPADAFEFENVDESIIQGFNLVSTNPKHGILNLEELKKDGLSPNNKLTVDNVTYYCTQPFKLGENHIAVIGLVELEVQKGQKQVFPRLFYLSNSQGTWRTMPGALKMGQELQHYHKGIAESDTQLPTALNIALLKLPLAEPKASPMYVNPNDLVKTYNLAPLSYDVKIQKLGLIDQQFEDFYYDPLLYPHRPAKPKAVLMPSLPKQPNFAKPIKEAEITLPLYGKVIARIYLSNDNSLQYLFYETQEEQQPGKVFLASVEDLKINIGRYGVREVGFEANHMDSPLLEYKQQIRVDYQPHLIRPQINNNAYNYYDWNWDYVRELPIIQAYYAAKGQAIPSGYI